MTFEILSYKITNLNILFRVAISDKMISVFYNTDTGNLTFSEDISEELKLEVSMKIKEIVDSIRTQGLIPNRAKEIE